MTFTLGLDCRHPNGWERQPPRGWLWPRALQATILAVQQVARG